MKSITPQRKVTRSIKAVDESGGERELEGAEDLDNPEDPCGDDGGGADCARLNALCIIYNLYLYIINIILCFFINIIIEIMQNVNKLNVSG